MTKNERTQRDIYGKDFDDGQDLITQHNARIAHHRASHDDDDADEEEEKTMDWDEDEMLAAADDVLDQLDAVQEVPHLRKAIRDLASESRRHHGSTQHLRGEISRVQTSLRQAYLSERSNRRGLVALARAVDTLCTGLIRLGQDKPSPLTKSVSTFLTPGDSLAKAQRVTRWVYTSFGPRGGQAVPYSREGCARLKLCKAISDTEAENWRLFDRLPDHVDMRNPQPQAQAVQAQAVSLQVQQALASMGVSPLVFPALARRA